MNGLPSIRKSLGLSQAELGVAIGVTQSAMSQYERGETTPLPEVARRLIEFAKTRGMKVSFDAIYAPMEPDPEVVDAGSQSEAAQAGS